MGRAFILGGFAVLVIAAAAFGVAIAAGKPRPAAPSIDVSVARCGHGWTPGPAGSQTLRLHNIGGQPAEVQVIMPATGGVAGELDALGPDAVRELRVDLGSGTYALRCELEGDDPVVGPHVRVTGSGRGGPVVKPVTYNDLYGPAQAYQKIVTAKLDPLVTKVDRLRDAIRGGDRDAAREAWLPAHLAYERLGGAYGAFGDLGDAIDGLPQPWGHLPPRNGDQPGTGEDRGGGGNGGFDEKGFTGFHRIERGLWHDESMTALRGPADTLAGDVRDLREQFSQERIDPLDLGLRAHEILEDAERVELTGQSDQGSGTELATVSANIEGTRDVMSVLRPLLRTRYPGLRDADAWLDRTDRVLAAQDHDGRWTPPEDLSTADREKVNGAVAGALERLAPIAEICEPRRVK